jgi:hypothetical protein
MIRMLQSRASLCLTEITSLGHRVIETKQSRNGGRLVGRQGVNGQGLQDHLVGYMLRFDIQMLPSLSY